MFSIIESFLSSKLPPEGVIMYLRGLEGLRKQYGSEVINYSESLVYQYKDLDSAEAIDKIYNDTIEYIVKGVRQFGVFFNEEDLEKTNYELYSNVLNGLFEIEDYEDPQSLLNIIEVSEDNETTMCEIISLISQSNRDELLPIIIKVNDDTISKIKDVLLERVRDDNNDDDIEYNLNPLLPLLVKSEFANQIPKELVSSLLSKPGTLPLQSLLKLYGYKLADINNAYVWVFIILVANDNSSPDDLFKLWGKYFEEERQAMVSGSMVVTIYSSLKEQYEALKLENSHG